MMKKESGLRLREAGSEEDIDSARRLFREYADSLGFGLDFQNFTEELAGLPGEYARPDGCIILAEEGAETAGCAALRKLSKEICEMKRMFVRPGSRGKGLGRKLAEAIISEAKKIGYKRMRLDTVASLKEANALYKSLGFQEIGPYRHNPLKGAVFLEKTL